MMIAKNFPLIVLLLLLVSAFVMPLLKSKNSVKLLAVFTMILCLMLSALTLSYVEQNGNIIYKAGHFEAPWGIELRIGLFEALMSILFTFVASLIIWSSLYSIEKEIKEERVKLYYTLCCILLASLLGIVFSNDLFNCFVFIEISSIAACGVVVIKDKKENIKAAMKYLILSSLGSGLVLMGIAFLYSVTGNLNMEYVGNELIKVYSQYRTTTLLALGLFTVGLGVKSAMFPVHIWLPDAHSHAPSTSSAMLSSLVLKAYIVMYIKVLYRAFGYEIVKDLAILELVLILGVFGMIGGSILALMQKDIKRMVAYSSVAQIGYIFFGIGLGNVLGLVSAVFHIIAHAITKSALFLISGNIIEKTHNKKIADMKGIGIEMPVSLGVFIVCGLSMIGIPLLAGFNSKWNFALAIIDSNRIFLVIILVVSSLLNALYYLPIIINAFFGEENIKHVQFKSKEKSFTSLVPVLILASTIVYFGIFSRDIMELINKCISGI